MQGFNKCCNEAPLGNETHDELPSRVSMLVVMFDEKT